MSRAPELCLAPRDRVGEGTYYLPKAGDHHLWRIAAPRDLKDIVKALNDPTMLKRTQVVRLLVGVQSESPSFIYLNSAGSSLCGTTVYIGRFAEAGKTSLLASFLRSNYDLELARPLLVDPEHVLRLVESEGIYYLFDIDDLWHVTAPRNLKEIVTTLSDPTKLEKLAPFCTMPVYLLVRSDFPERSARRGCIAIRVFPTSGKRRLTGLPCGLELVQRAEILMECGLYYLTDGLGHLEKTNLDLISPQSPVPDAGIFGCNFSDGWENFLGQFILPPDLVPRLKERYGVKLMQFLLLSGAHRNLDPVRWDIHPRAHALIHSPGEIWARTVAAAPCPYTGRRGCIRWTTVITYGTWRLKSLKAILEALNDSTELEVTKLEAGDAEYDDGTD
ncbi:hypothetical protein K438DRAFT_1775981 [Mycena galopus ATCC 62051]|nr:hypothetical protein K438DRAFT_1775981 [Mycena galopus ATCC 62051]